MVSRFGEVTHAFLPLPSVAQMPANLKGWKRKTAKPTTFINYVFTSSSSSSSSRSPWTKPFSPAGACSGIRTGAGASGTDAAGVLRCESPFFLRRAWPLPAAPSAAMLSCCSSLPSPRSHTASPVHSTASPAPGRCGAEAAWFLCEEG